MVPGSGATLPVTQCLNRGANANSAFLPACSAFRDKRPEAQNNPRHAVCSAKLYERRRLLLGASGCLDNGGGGGSVLTQIVTHLAMDSYILASNI